MIAIILHMHIRRIGRCIFLFVLIFAMPAGAIAESSLADPDCLSSLVEYNGTPAVKLGDYYSWRTLSIGGFIAVRNEKRFNQGVLPNHAWRGFLSLSNAFRLIEREKMDMFLDLGFEHESAHPAGALGTGDDAHEMIYDNIYRGINLNSILLRFRPHLGQDKNIRLFIDYQLYFLSRNTPELPGTDLSWSNGLSGGIGYSREIFASLSAYVSVFDRIIFQGPGKSRGSVYYNQGDDVVAREVDYPLVRRINTVSVKAGVIHPLSQGGRSAGFYIRYLYGNPFGFVDSRENRHEMAIGMELLH